MDNYFDELYNDSMNKLNDFWVSNPEYLVAINDGVSDGLEASLDGWDYCFAILFGLFGTFISTNKQLGDYLNEIHNCASENAGEYTDVQKFIAKLVHHKNTWIDIPDGATNFVNRGGENANCLFHRLLWGHDILSTSGDNPFSLMVKQMGPLKGVIAALQHLVGDTMSKQGLPFPGTSYLDYTDGEGKISNYIINVCKKLSEQAKGNDVKVRQDEIYSHLATVRMQDLMDLGVVAVSTKVYFAVRHIENKIRQIQFRVIAYGVNFFAQAIVGAIRQGGVPYINLTVGIALIKNTAQLYIESNKETRYLRKKTNILIAKDDEVISKANELDSKIVRYDTAEEYIDEIERGQKNVDDLIRFWEDE